MLLIRFSPTLDSDNGQAVRYDMTEYDMLNIYQSSPASNYLWKISGVHVCYWSFIWRC